MQEQIEDLIAQSEQIAEHIRLQNWELIEILAQQRQADLETLFKAPIPPELTSQVIDMINYILNSDKEIVALINKEKESIIYDYLDMKSYSHAGKTYQSIASLNNS